MPGIKGLYPSTPQDAFNAILAAYEDNNPVMLFEHKALYRRGRSTVQWDPEYRRVWHPRKLRDGDFATVVTYGEMVHLADEACEYFAGQSARDYPQVGQENLKLAADRCRIEVMQIILMKMVEGLGQQQAYLCS